MDKKAVGLFKKTLINLRGQLAGDYEKAVDASFEEFGSDIPDITDEASRTATRRVLLEIGDKNYETMIQIEDALERIEKNIFGLCVECENEIPEKRLELLPYAEHCVKCKELLE